MVQFSKNHKHFIEFCWFREANLPSNLLVQPEFALYLGFNNCFNPTMNIENLTPAQLRKIADLQEKIASLQNELVALGGNGSRNALSFQNW